MTQKGDSYIKLSISSENVVLNFVTVNYSLYQSSETILH